MKIYIVWMAKTLRELELLSPLLVQQSTLPASRPLHRAAALEIFHLTTGPFLVIYSSHIPFSFCLPLHSHLVFVWFSLPFLSLTLELKLYGIFSPYSQITHSNNFEHSNNGWHNGCDIELPPRNPWFGSRCSQLETLYFHYFTISLASIFTSALST